MSAFDRLPEDYRKLCVEIGKASVPPKQAPLSAQNRRVRFAADSHLAGLKSFPNGDTRQQRRARARPWKTRA